MSFVPLHLISSYSLLESAIKFDSLFSKNAEYGYKTFGLCDYNVMYGFPSFNKYCAINKIRPIFGITVFCDGNEISLYAKNEEGYKNLISISYEASKSENGSLSIDILQRFCDNLVAIISTEFSSIFSIPNQEIIAEKLLKFNSVYKPDFYIGLVNHTAPFSTPENEAIVKRVREFIKKYPYTIVAFPTIKYVEQKDRVIIDMLHSIKENKRIGIELGEEILGDDYLKSEVDINSTYFKDEIENTNLVANSCSFNFVAKRGMLLKFPNVQDSQGFLKETTFRRLKELNIDDAIHKERLIHELNVINKMGYNDYFLIVSDYVNWAKNNDILVGPGRGSGAGSLVSYCLNITEIDPLKYDLLFERFLNEERISMPDIDIDFEDDKRELVVNYLRNKYGSERVANIITMQTFGAKQSIRDIGRIYDINENDIINHICSLLVNPKLSLRDSYRFIPSFKEEIAANDYHLKIVAQASLLEGLPRQHGLHAAGIVLNNEELINSLPIQYEPNLNGNISQFEMEYLEKQGFLKMDLLGLTNLSIIRFILKLIKINKGIDLKFSDIPIDDTRIYQLISNNLTQGIFQLESAGMKNAIYKVKPTCIDDIVSILALFRPGPMGNIDVYAERKNNNKKFTYIDKSLEPILKSTYGIIIYQEQVMLIAQKMANFSLSKADILRHAISKKNKNEMSKIRTEFIEGCINNNYSKVTAQNVFSYIEQFASYGFNKAHSVSYAIITARMAYLKAVYPVEFYIAALSSIAKTNDTKYKDFLIEMKRSNIKISLPNINISEFIFVYQNDEMYIPFTSIKGIMTRTIEIILHEREKKPYLDYFDFINRTYEYNISYDQIEKLINSGAFDSFNKNRLSLLNKTTNLIQRASLISKSKGQFSLFNDPIEYDDSIEEDLVEKIEKEQELLGFSITDNPLKHVLKSINRDITPISDLEPNYKENEILAIVKTIKKITTRKSGKQMGFLTLSDADDNTIDAVLFPDSYNKFVKIIEKNKSYIFNGITKNGTRGLSFVINNVESLGGNDNEENNNN